MDRVSRLTRMDGAGAMMLQRLSVEGLGWAPTAGNVMAIMSFSMCMILNQHFTGKLSNTNPCGLPQVCHVSRMRMNSNVRFVCTAAV